MGGGCFLLRAKLHLPFKYWISCGTHFLLHFLDNDNRPSTEEEAGSFPLENICVNVVHGLFAID